MSDKTYICPFCNQQFSFEDQYGYWLHCKQVHNHHIWGTDEQGAKKLSGAPKGAK